MDIDSVLNQMRQEHSPTREDRDRVRAALSTALVASGTVGAAHLVTTTGLDGAAAVNGAAAAAKGAAAVKGTLLALPVWIKGSVGVGALIAAIGGGVYGVNSYRTSHANPVPTATSKQVNASAGRLDEGAVPVDVPAEPPLSAPPQETPHVVPRVAAGPDGQARSEQGRRVPGVKSRSGGSKSSAAQGPTTTSLAELQLIGEASRAIREGRTGEARTALSEHEKLYSNTALSQERAGLDLIARCSEGNSDETRRAAEALLRSSPRSPLAGTIRRECLK